MYRLLQMMSVMMRRRTLTRHWKYKASTRSLVLQPTIPPTATGSMMSRTSRVRYLEGEELQ